MPRSSRRGRMVRCMELLRGRGRGAAGTRTLRARTPGACRAGTRLWRAAPARPVVEGWRCGQPALEPEAGEQSGDDRDDADEDERREQAETQRYGGLDPDR